MNVIVRVVDAAFAVCWIFIKIDGNLIVFPG